MWAILTLQPVILIAGVLFSFFFQNFICFIILQQLKQFYYIVSFLLLATENQVYGKKFKRTHFYKVSYLCHTSFPIPYTN